MARSTKEICKKANVCAGGSGGSALAGYDYQVDVSIWLALDLILANKFSQEILLEPASQEDLEAEIDDSEPGRVASVASMGGYTLVVQAKLRSREAWTVARTKALLKHGSERRPSAATRLSAPNVRYLLVTNAALHGEIHRLGVRKPGSWPNAAKMPSSIEKCLPAGAAGRVAVIGNEDEERLESDIKQLLTGSFRVPNAQWQACLKHLREETRIRIVGGGSGRWRREELEEVIRTHQGYIASSPELENYIHPSNWGNIRAAIDERRAVLIVGQSGTGKTMATLKLYEELRQVIPGLARVPITLGPPQLKNDGTEPPVLYDIEDPWGRFDFVPDSRPWNDQLPQFFAHASHDRLIVATSRLDVAQSSRALEGLRRWIVPLETEHYGRVERHKLYRSRIGLLPRELQVAAAEWESKVLSELGTPLEIQKFFDALATLDRERLANPAALISEAIHTAHQNSIERTVVEQIEQRKDVRAAAVLWGLLKATDKLSLGVIRTIEEDLADKDVEMINGVLPLIQFFVAARNVRQREDIVAYYHPRVEAGIEHALLSHRLIVSKTFVRLIEVLTSPAAPGEEWGAAAAVRLLAAANKIRDLKVTPTRESGGKIDSWIENQLALGGDEFRANLVLASEAGSAKSNVSEVARYLLNRRDRDFPGIFEWAPPDRDEVWYARMRADPATKPIVEAFIRDVLPTVHADYRSSFATNVERLAPDLSDVFIHTAVGVARLGYFSTLDAIVEGALRDLDGFEVVVDAAVESVSQFDEDRPEVAKEHLAIVNREYSEDHAQMLIEDDRGAASFEFLEGYVKRIRATKGWRHLTQHRHSERIVSYWLKALANEELPDAEEVEGVFMASYGSEHEELLWFVLSRAWGRRFLEALTARVAEGHENREVRRAALSCLVEHAPADLEVICRKKIARGDAADLVEIAIDMGHLRNARSGRGERQESAASTALALLPGIMVELSEDYLAVVGGRTPTSSAEACAMMVAARDGSVDVRRFRILLDATLPLEVEDDIRWLLATASEYKIAVVAVEAAIRRGMSPVVEAALDHKFAAVSALALTAMAEPLAAPLPDSFLAKAEAKGSPIRMALVSLLDTKPHENHLATLLKLARDTWSNKEFYYDDEVSFPIAQTAVDAMRRVASLRRDDLKQLYGIAIETPDHALRAKIFELLAKNGGCEYQDRLFDLAVRPGRIAIKRSASIILLQVRAVVAPEVVARITSGLLTARAVPATVVVRLALLLAWRAKLKAVRDAADVLAVDANRRVLLLLLIRVTKDRDSEAAKALVDLLPVNHVGVVWALGGEIESPNDAQLADLGDPAMCAEVLRYMK